MWLERKGYTSKPRTRWQQVPRGTLGRCPLSPAHMDFHWVFFDTQGQKRARQVGDMCPQWEFTVQAVFNAALPSGAPVIFHALLNCSTTFQVWAFLSPPSVASPAASPAATKKACSSVIVLQSTPRVPKLKRKIFMTYHQMTACKHFRKWSEHDKRKCIWFLIWLFHRLWGWFFPGFKVTFFNSVVVLWVIMYYAFLLYISFQYISVVWSTRKENLPLKCGLHLNKGDNYLLHKGSSSACLWTLTSCK